MFNDYEYQRALQEYEAQFLEPIPDEEELQERYKRKQEALEALGDEQFEEMGII